MKKKKKKHVHVCLGNYWSWNGYVWIQNKCPSDLVNVNNILYIIKHLQMY